MELDAADDAVRRRRVVAVTHTHRSQLAWGQGQAQGGSAGGGAAARGAGGECQGIGAGCQQASQTTALPTLLANLAAPWLRPGGVGVQHRVLVPQPLLVLLPAHHRLLLRRPQLAQAAD